MAASYLIDLLSTRNAIGGRESNTLHAFSEHGKVLN